MELFKTVDDYEKIAKIGDIIVLGGRGIMDGIKNISSKYDTYKVSRIQEDGTIVIKNYRGKKGYIISPCAYDQEIALLTKKEFKKLT